MRKRRERDRRFVSGRSERNTVEFEGRFAREAACREYRVRLRWPDGFRCPKVGRCQGLAGSDGAAAMRRVWTADLGGGGHDLSRHAHPVAHVVPRHVVGQQSEDRGERQGAPAGLGVGELRDGVDLAAHIASGDGATWARPAGETRLPASHHVPEVAEGIGGGVAPRVHRVVSLLKRWLLGTPSRCPHACSSGLLPRRAFTFQSGHDLRALMRSGRSDEHLAAAIGLIWNQRVDRYSEIRTEETARTKKIEMSYIGG